MKTCYFRPNLQKFDIDKSVRYKNPFSERKFRFADGVNSMQLHVYFEGNSVQIEDCHDCGFKRKCLLSKNVT